MHVPLEPHHVHFEPHQHKSRICLVGLHQGACRLLYPDLRHRTESAGGRCGMLHDERRTLTLLGSTALCHRKPSDQNGGWWAGNWRGDAEESALPLIFTTPSTPRKPSRSSRSS